MPDKQAYCLGQIFAVLNRLAQKKGDALNLDLVLTAPLVRFGEYTAKLEPFRHPELDERLAALVASIDSIPEAPLSQEQQGDFFLGFYHELGAAKADKPGRPQAANARDWSGVDWSESDAVISRKMGVARQTVRWHRQRRTES